MAITLISCAAPASAAIIRLKETATLDAPVITLADVAEVLDSDAAAAGRLGAATLAPTPAPGRRLRLDFATIRGRLAALGFNLAELEFSGRSAVLVTAAAAASAKPEPAAPKPATPRPVPSITEAQRRKAEAAVAAAVAAMLHHNYPELGPLNVAATLRPEQLPAVLGAADLRFEAAASRPLLTETQLFELRFQDQDRQAQRLQVACQVSKLPRILTVKHNLPKGQMVTAEDLAWLHVREMPREAALEQPDQAIGKEATRPLRAGEPISDADVRVVPLVRSGDIVTIYSRQRGIVARIEAKATGNGALGDLVEFSTLDRREKLRAQVTGFHEAEVLADNPSTGNFNGAGGVRVILQDNK